MNAPRTPQPPRAEARPEIVSAAVGSRVDRYYWLRDDAREDAQVLAHLHAENHYFEQATSDQQPLRDALFAEMKARIKPDDVDPPEFDNGYWYYSRYEAGHEYAIHCRRHATMEAPEEILLDDNARADDRAYYHLGAMVVSPDNRWLAWTEDSVGRREYQLLIRELATGTTSAPLAQNIQPDLAWASDSRRLLYIQQDAATLLGNRLYMLDREARGNAQLLFEETDDRFFMGVHRARSGRFVFLTLQATETSEWRIADAAAQELRFNPVIPRTDGHEYDVEDNLETLVIRSNEEAPNFRLLRAPLHAPAERAQWQEVIGHRDDALIEGFEVFDDWLAVNERIDGLLRLSLLPRDDARPRRIEGKERPSAIQLIGAPEPSSPTLRFAENSLTTPGRIFDLTLASGARRLVKQQPVMGSFDAAAYCSDYRWITARDGARVPVSLLYHRDTPLDASAPLLLTGYGAYGICLDPDFSTHRLSLLDRGWVLGVAHVRGGEDLGRAWYDDGRLANKANTFRDFMDVSDALIEQGVCAPEQLHASGGSAGGLLMGVIANEHPARYRSISAHVPFVDILTTMLDPSIPLTTNEYDEWGNPEDSDEYAVIAAYSPYDNIREQAYPAMLVTSGLWDSQVQYWEPAKWVAKLRDHQTGDAPIYLHTEMEAGHGGRSGRFQHLHELARDYAFVIARSAHN